MTKAKTFDVIGDGTIQARTGEKLERTLRLERINVDPHGTGPAISLLGADLVYSGGATRVAGLVCVQCDAGRVPMTDHPAITKSQASFPHNPSSYQCELCGKVYGRLSGLIEAFGGTWQEQLALLQKIGGSTPLEKQWTIAEHDGKRSMRETSRSAIDAAVTPTTRDTLRLLKVIAHHEDQVLSLLQDRDLPLRETKIDRVARPLEQWNVRPTPAERTELKEAQRDHRREVEASVDQELRALRTEKLAAGL